MYTVILQAAADIKALMMAVSNGLHLVQLVEWSEIECQDEYLHSPVTHAIPKADLIRAYECMYIPMHTTLMFWNCGLEDWLILRIGHFGHRICPGVHMITSRRALSYSSKVIYTAVWLQPRRPAVRSCYILTHSGRCCLLYMIGTIIHPS